MRLPLLLLAISSALHAQTDVVMNRYDRSAHGANLQERELNPARLRAGHFGKIFSYYVDGAVYAQPLYVHGIATVKGGLRNVVFVATMNDKVYAFDAAEGGPPLWMRDLTDERSGVTPVPTRDVTNSNDLNIVGNAGIEGTPVIDVAAQALYLVARTKESGHYVQRLHRLDLRSGDDQIPAAVIEGHDGEIAFDPKLGNQRAALALVHGNVVIAWASHEDIGPYHGWIMAYDADTLKQNAVMCITPNGEDGGIWQSGRGPAMDESGAMYFETGNGSWDGKRSFGNSVIKLRVEKNGLRVEDDYTPHDFARQNQTDADLGSSGPLLIADKGLLICGNKQGQLFLLDPTRLGGMTAEDSGLQQTLNLSSGRVLAGPAYWVGPKGPELFIWNEAGVLEMLRFTGNRLDANIAAKASVSSHGSPGGALTVSSDGAQPGSGIVWSTVGRNKSADHGNAEGVLYAFDAETLDQLWNSEGNAARDRMGTLVKFVPPLVVDGRVYVANYDNAVNVYGMLSK